MTQEYAPQYTTRERLRRLAVCLPLGLGGYALCQWWLFPRLKTFAEHAQCVTVLGMPGSQALFYGIFVGMPLFLAVVMTAVFMPSAVGSIKTRRYPPPGEKVYRPTKIKTGRRAVAASLVPLAVALLFLCIAGWGYVQASQIIARANAAHPYGWEECVTPKVPNLTDNSALFKVRKES